MRARVAGGGFGRFLVLILFLGFLLGLAHGWQQRPSFPAPIVSPPSPEPDPSEVQSPEVRPGLPPENLNPSSKIGIETGFHYLVTCLPSGTVVTLKGAAPSQALGLDLGQFRSLFPLWHVVSFTPQLVELAAEIQADPKTLEDTLFLGVYEGKVAVFFGRPGGDFFLLKEVTAIPVTRLLPEDRRRLQEGVPTDPKRWKELLAGLTE